MGKYDMLKKIESHSDPSHVLTVKLFKNVLHTSIHYM